jgi:hypothetical protein
VESEGASELEVKSPTATSPGSKGEVASETDEEQASETDEEQAPETDEEQAPETDEEQAPETDEEQAPEAGPAPKLLAPAPWLTARLLTPRHLRTPSLPPGPKPLEASAPAARGDEEIYALVALDLVLSPSQSLEDVVYKGPEGFALDIDERAGTAWTLALHAGAEFEPFPTWVKTRLGTYYEPSRFEDVDGRVHVTGGFDVHFPHIWAVRKAIDQWNWDPRIIEWVDVPLMAQLTIDRADRYLSIGVSVGVWN